MKARLAALLIGLSFGADQAVAQDASGRLFYTIRFPPVAPTPTPPAPAGGVKRVDYTWVKATKTLTFLNQTTIWDGTGATNGAGNSDGLFFTPSGHLVVANWINAELVKLDPTAINSILSGPLLPEFSLVYHLLLHPGNPAVDGLITDAGGTGGDVGFFGVFPHTPALGAGLACPVPTPGAGSFVWPISFAANAAGNLFATFSNGFDNVRLGGGGFGAISLGTTTSAGCGTVTTEQLLPLGQSAAHSLAYDPFLSAIVTGTPHADFILFGGTTISHVRVNNPGPPGTAMMSASILSSYDLSGMVTELDQGQVDGMGHLFVGDEESGDLVFADYTMVVNTINEGTAGAGAMGDPEIVVLQFLDDSLDDVGPVTGLGAPPTSTPTPTATTTNTPSGPTHTPTSTFTPSNTSTPSNTPDPSITPTQTPTPTITLTPSRTLTPSSTPSRTSTPTPSRTSTASSTPTRTLTPSITNTIRSPLYEVPTLSGSGVVVLASMMAAFAVLALARSRR